MKKLMLSCFLVMALFTSAFALDEWNKTSPADGNSPSDIGTLVRANNNATDRFFSNGRFDCKLSYVSAASISVGAGSVVCSNSAGMLRLTRANPSATTVTWSDIDTGSEASSTNYYVYAVADTSAETFTIKISTSASAPTGVTYYKRLGYFYNDASSNINIYGIYDDTFLVSQSQLKTAIGEVSSAVNGISMTLPGGEYGFFPQIKGGTTDYDVSLSLHASNAPTTYTTSLYFGSSTTVYAQQRYVTASGTDMWIFLLVDKNTDEIVGSYQALDHPAYGNGGDFIKVSQPFGNYDNQTQQVVLVEKDTTEALKDESIKSGKSILELINDDYKPKMSKKETYIPLHSGRFIGKDKEMVTKLTDDISVRKLTKLIQAEKDAKKVAQDAKIFNAQKKQAEEKLIQDKIRTIAIDQLKAEGKIK